MQHILIIPSWYPSNAEDVGGSFFREQALALKKAGYNVGIITPALRSIHQRKSFIGRYGAEFNMDCDMPTYRLHGLKLFPYSQRMNLAYWEIMGLWLFDKYVKKHGLPDVVHVHSMIYGTTWALAIKKKYNIPFIITEHSTEYALSTISPYLLAYLKQASTHADGNFAVSTSLATLLSHTFSCIPGAEWKVLPNLVSDRFFDVKETKAVFKSDSNFVFLNVAVLLKKKGHETLIRAFSKVFAGDKSILLKICGDGPERENLIELVEQLNISSQVVFLGEGSRERVVSELMQADVFVLSSKYETFGVVLVEALAMGLPVVSTACGGSQDIVREGEDGFLVPVDDIDAMAQTMLKMKENRSAFDSKSISESCKNRFSADAYVKSYAYVYNNCF